jgi:hypothetical protein
MDKDTQPQSENDTIPQISTEEKIRIIANLLIDRILENQLTTGLKTSDINISE